VNDRKRTIAINLDVAKVFEHHQRQTNAREKENKTPSAPAKE
jgi:hypothetical protein